MEVSLQKQHNHYPFFIFSLRTIFLPPYLLTFRMLMAEQSELWSLQPDNHCSGCSCATEIAIVMVVVVGNYLAWKGNSLLALI